MDFRMKLAESIAENTGLEVAAASEMLETPPDPDMGDFAFPCFKLAKTLRKAPPLIAAELREKLGSIEGFDRIENAGGYLNFFTDKAAFARTVIETVLDKGDKYGSSSEGNGRNICLDYSSINIAKPFGIHHITTTVLGNSLRRIYDHLGYHTISINHLGDWGTQFGKMIVAYKRWGDRSVIENGNSTRELVNLYVKFHEEAEKDPSLNDEARAAFHRIELHSPEEWELFEWFKDVTLKDVAKVYDLLGITFDSYNGDLEQEKEVIRRETRAIVDKCFELGDGDIAVGAVRAVKAGVIDIPFAPSRFNAGKMLPARDNNGAIRILNVGNLPFTQEMKDFNAEMINERARAEKRSASFQMVTDDVYAISKGRLVGRPQGIHGLNY